MSKTWQPRQDRHHRDGGLGGLAELTTSPRLHSSGGNVHLLRNRVQRRTGS